MVLALKFFYTSSVSLGHPPLLIWLQGCSLCSQSPQWKVSSRKYRAQLFFKVLFYHNGMADSVIYIYMTSANSRTYFKWIFLGYSSLVVLINLFWHICEIIIACCSVMYYLTNMPRPVFLSPPLFIFLLPFNLIIPLKKTLYPL